MLQSSYLGLFLGFKFCFTDLWFPNFSPTFTLLWLLKHILLACWTGFLSPIFLLYCSVFFLLVCLFLQMKFWIMSNWKEILLVILFSLCCFGLISTELTSYHRNTTHLAVLQVSFMPLGKYLFSLCMFILNICWNILQYMKTIILVCFATNHQLIGIPSTSVSFEKAMAPTPVLLPGKSQWWGSMVGCSPWGR